MEGKEAVATAVLAMVDAVNRGDFATAVAAFAEAPVIVEDIAPYIWRGPGAPSGWLSAMGANAARLNVQSVLLALDQPTRIEVDVDAAYAVFPGDLSLGAVRRDLVARGLLTLTLQNEGDRWLISSLVWSGPELASR